MEIGKFLRSRHARVSFPHEATYQYSESADAIISLFCKNYAIPRDTIVFHPTYTSRASPELFRLEERLYIVWDYHFAELIQTFNLATIALVLLDAENPITTAGVTRETALSHFRACLFRFLSSQFFRRSHFSLVFAEAFSELACKLGIPTPRDLADRLARLRGFQWSYILHHELAHITFSRLSEQQRKLEFDHVLIVIKLVRDNHDIANSLAGRHSRLQSDPERADRWWSAGDDVYGEMLTNFSEKMTSNFDKAIAEEIACDILALRMSVLHWCTANNIPFNFHNHRCVAGMEQVRAAANSINNFRSVLEITRAFWVGLAEEHQVNDKKIPTRLVISELREKARSALQEMFLRGSVGLEAGWYGNVAAALGKKELRLDNKYLHAHLKKSMRERRTGVGIEGFDEQFTQAWQQLIQVATALMDDEVVEPLFEAIQRRMAELSPEQARKKAQEIIEW
jgi:hypothetical protein